MIRRLLAQKRSLGASAEPALPIPPPKEWIEGDWPIELLRTIESLRLLLEALSEFG